MLVVLKDGPIKTDADLKGKKVSVSTRRLADLLAACRSCRGRQGWGDNGIDVTPLRRRGPDRALKPTRSTA